MFSFKYIGSNGGGVPACDKLAVLAQSKGELKLSEEVGSITAVNLDAAKRGMCAIRKQCLCSVDALALGEDGRLYFIEFKDRNLRALCSQGKNPKKEELRIEKGKKKNRDSRHRQCRDNDNRVKPDPPKQDSPIDVELRKKMFDSVLLAGLGDEQWRTVDFVASFGDLELGNILDVQGRSVFVLVYNDSTYDANATDGERKFLSALEEQSQIVNCPDPQISESKIYWGLEEFVAKKYYTEVHTLSVPEFESYSKNRFKSVYIECAD